MKNPSLNKMMRDMEKKKRKSPVKKDIIYDPMGQWNHPGEITVIPGDSMATYGYGDIPLYVEANNGFKGVIPPNTGDYQFPGATQFTEYPLEKAQQGINLNLPRYNKRENKRFGVNPYMFGFNPQSGVNIHGLGAKTYLNILNSKKNKLGITGDVNTVSVGYPGGMELFGKPQFSGGLRFTHTFKDGGDISIPNLEEGSWLDRYAEGGSLPRFQGNQGSSQVGSFRPWEIKLKPKPKFTQQQIQDLQKQSQIYHPKNRYGSYWDNKIKQQELEKEAQEKAQIQERKNAAATREKVIGGDENAIFTFPDGKTKAWKDMDFREQAYVSGKNLGSFNNNNWTDYINPIAMIGSMGEGLTTAPYVARETNSYMPYVFGVGAPLLTGALAGAGAKSVGQFANNLVNPLVGFGDVAKNIAQQTGRGISNAYDKVATGNSFLTDFGFPAWKMEKPLANTANLQALKNLRNLTDDEARVVNSYLEDPYNIKSSPEDSKILESIMKKNYADLSGTNEPITKIQDYYVSARENPTIAGSYGETVSFPQNEGRSWSLGRGRPEAYVNRDKQRLVIPSRYAKQLKGFHAIDYTDPRLTFNSFQERELFGNIPEGFKVIGKSNEEGFQNIFLKPKKGYGGDISIPDLEEGNWLNRYDEGGQLQQFAPGGATGDCPPGQMRLPNGQCGTFADLQRMSATAGLNRALASNQMVWQGNAPKTQVIVPASRNAASISRGDNTSIQRKPVLNPRTGKKEAASKSDATFSQQWSQPLAREVDPEFVERENIAMGLTAAPFLAPIVGSGLAAAGFTPSAVGTALTTSLPGVPGASLANVAGAYGITDFALNRAPQLPGQIRRGEYTDALGNVLMGGLDLMGANIASPSLFKNIRPFSMTKGLGRNIRSSNLTKGKAATAFSTEENLAESLTDRITTSINTIKEKGRGILEELSSPEGVRRLKMQFKQADPTLSDADIDQLVATRLNEVNDAIIYNKPEFFLKYGQGAEGTATQDKLEYYFPTSNAHWAPSNPHPEIMFSKIRKDQSSSDYLNSLMDKSGYSQFLNPDYNPGSITLGSGLEKNVMVLDHEIAHAIQKGGESPIDKQLLQLLPAKRRSWLEKRLHPMGTQERNDKFYFDYAGGRPYKNEAYPFLVEQRRNMIESGILKDRYDKITPWKLFQARLNADKAVGPNYMEGNRLIKFTPFWKYGQLSKIMNTAPALGTGIGTGVGMSYLTNNNSQNNIYNNGGITNNKYNLPLAQDGWWDDIVGAVKTVGDVIVPTNVRSLGRMGFAAVGLPTGGNFVRKEDFTKQQLKFIYDAAIRAKQRTGQTRGGTMYSDYGKDYADIWGRGALGVARDMYLDPNFSAATTLGRFTYNVNDDGSISVSDIYDFNNEKKGILKQAVKTVDNMVGQDNRRNVNFNISSQDFRQFGGLQKMKGGGNANVRSYQTMLNQKYNAGLAEDGKWGSKTQAAYEKYILKKGAQQTKTQPTTPLINRSQYPVAESTFVPKIRTIPTPISTEGPKLPKDVKPVNGYVDLSKYNIDPLSKEGIELAKTISAKYPSAKFICTAKGCAEIARKGAQAYGDDFGWSNAWGFGNENPIEFTNPAYEGMIGNRQGPLPDPRTFAVPADVLNLPGGRMVGLNRKNNRVGFIPATTREMANDSYDYANQKLYPGSRGYEHIGYSLGNNMLMHGTGKNQDHPAYYVIDNMNDGIGLSGYGKYEPVETMTPASGLSRAYGNVKKFVTSRKGGGTTYSGGLWYKEGGMPCYECGGMYQSGNVVGSQNSGDPLTNYNRDMNYRNKLNLLNQTAPTFFMNPNGTMGMQGGFSNINQPLPTFPMTNYNNNLQLLNQNNPYYMMGPDGRPVMRGGVPPGILPSPSSLGVKTSFMDGGDIPNYMQDPNPLYNFGGYFPQAPRFQMGGGNMIPYPSLNNYIPSISEMKQGGISIDPSKKGTFTAAATRAGMGVQAFASKVLSAPEGKYSPAMRKKANFARNAASWKKEEGGLVEGQIIDVTPDMLEQLKMGGYTFEIVND